MRPSLRSLVAAAAAVIAALLLLFAVRTAAMAPVDARPLRPAHATTTTDS